MIVSRAQGRIAGRVADLFTFCASVATLTLVSGDLFASLHIFGMPKSVPTSPQTLFCLLLLTAVTVVRRTEDGMFSILTGRGIGGNLARILAPILLVLPFVREGLRAHILGEGRIPAHYATAILASMSAMVSIVLLAYLVARINSMEMEIRGLTLRDELTQLYNLRGFSLLAEQALRLAQRSDTPFSVLYIDLDNLKQTNDSLGHQAGSAFLAETGEILRDTFRETDLLGRIGGDEFAVAGQFSQLSMALAAQRLEARCKEKNAETGRQFALSFSLGHVTAEEGKKETLEELLVKADQAMYEAKRGKKTRQAEERLPRLREQHGAGPQLA
jgi:diguanylate cyclase (GGDEF)-like protein